MDAVTKQAKRGFRSLDESFVVSRTCIRRPLAVVRHLAQVSFTRGASVVVGGLMAHRIMWRRCIAILVGHERSSTLGRSGCWKFAK